MGIKYDSLGDRMKMYEATEADRRFIPMLPVYARIDGRSFSKFTKGMNRPCDESMSSAMIETTKYLVKETNACVGYTQSDEISLAWYSDDYKSQIFFDGRIQKMVSQLAALASVKFMYEAMKHWPEKLDNKLPSFDARVFCLPTLTEASNCFVWREWDATKNSISMAAHAVYSHKQLNGKNSAQKQDMLIEKGINWNNYPIHFKRGTYVKRVNKKVWIDDDVWNKIPDTKKPKSRYAVRSYIEECAIPPITRILNRNEFFFFNHDPIVREQ